MNGELQLNINEEALKNKTNMDILINSCDIILNSSENDFNILKNKNIFNRFWDLITLSQENNIILAKDITSISQLQNIVIKVLASLSENNLQITKFVYDNQDKIIFLLENQKLHDKEIISIKRALSSAVYYPPIKISEIPFHDKELIDCALYKYSSQHPENKLAQSYNQKIEVWLDLKEGIPNDIEFDYASLKKLQKKESAELLFTKICEMTLIFSKVNSRFNKLYQKATEFIDISNPKKKEIWRKINNCVKNKGKEWLVQKFDDEALSSYYVDSKALKMNPSEEICEYYDENSNSYVPEEEEQEGKLDKATLEKFNQWIKNDFPNKKFDKNDTVPLAIFSIANLIIKNIFRGQKHDGSDPTGVKNLIEF